MMKPFNTARSLLARGGRGLRFSSGLDGIDRLLGFIEGGMSYLFYGDGSAVSHLVHSILVNGLRTALISSVDLLVIYINSTDYYSKRNPLDVDLLGFMSKRLNVSPHAIFSGVQVYAAYSPARQEEIVLQASETIRNSNSACLVVLHDPTCFLYSERTRVTGFKSLNHAFVRLWQVGQEAGATLITTSPSRPSVGRSTPGSVGSHYLKHMSTVVVHLEWIDGIHTGLKVTMMKHPSRSTPSSGLAHLDGPSVSAELKHEAWPEERLVSGGMARGGANGRI
jgi:hypothetical protein